MRICKLLAIVAYFIPVLAVAQTNTAQKAIILKRTIEINHLAPRPVDDSFSADVFKAFIKSIDSRSLYFTDTEYKKLLNFKTTLDDEVNGKSTGFFQAVLPLYEKALQRGDSILNSLLKKPLDFSKEESITSSKEHTFNFSTDVPALSNRWSRYLKYQLLNLFYDIASDDSTGKTTLRSVIAAKEPELREKLKLTESKTIKKILNHPSGFSNYINEIYLNAIAMAFDPHSNYFSPQGKEQFQASLSTEELSFGLDLDENDKGEIIITHITPGGPAWKSGDINKGDQLISLLWEGKEVVDMTGLSIEDAYDVLEQPVSGRLVFKIKKADGTSRTVLLRKEKIENEENVVKSFILQGDKKIGYILLPSFYTEWENETGSSCANDVAKEIVKLKRDNIDGLILDVRYNGGGSLGEAMDMIGIFVDEGPLMGQQQRNGKVQFLKDPNRGTIYNGPLGLMINGQSASASEILAASLQDYNRAVIIGSNSFGKSTMQQMFGVDTMTTRSMMGSIDKDMVKITTGKLYRLNGESAQLNGVTPDIILPDAFDALDYREKFYPNVLESGKTDKNNYYKPLPALPVAALASKSTQRLNSDESFKAIRKLLSDLQERKHKTQTIPLKADTYEQWEKKNELDLGILQHKGVSAPRFSIVNHSLDKTLLQNNSYAQEINNSWIESISQDIYIQEAFLVLCDLVNLQTGKN